LFVVELRGNYNRHPNAKVSTAAAIQMGNTTTLCNELMTVLSTSRDNEVKITVKSL
jgi:hypothetical protein